MGVRVSGQERRHRGMLAVMMSLALFVGLVVTSGPQTGVPWGDILPEDALHRSALLQAEIAGLIDVEKVYDAGGVLRISLKNSEPLGENVYQFLKDKSYEFMDAGICSYENLGYDECIPSILRRVGWNRHSILPAPVGYGNVLFHFGGESARREIRGWAGWRQVWPVISDSVSSGAATRNTGDGGVVGQGGEGRFDVSDVDVTNFPEIDCSRTSPGDYSCGAWKQFPGVGIAGQSDYYRTIYYQIKDPPEGVELEALKDKLYPCRDIVGPCYYENGNLWRIMDRAIGVEIIPAKYDYGELWRWATILDRFALSAGNTIGILEASASTNRGGLPEGTIWPQSNLQPAGLGRNEAANTRETILVWALEAQVVADALPQLLPQLGIPVDAVGIVAPAYEGWVNSYLIFSDDASRIYSPAYREYWGQDMVGSVVASGLLIGMVMLAAVVVVFRGYRARRRLA